MTKNKHSIDASYSVIIHNCYTLAWVHQCRLFPDEFVLQASAFQTSVSNTLAGHEVILVGSRQH